MIDKDEFILLLERRIGELERSLKNDSYNDSIRSVVCSTLNLNKEILLQMQ